MYKVHMNIYVICSFLYSERYVILDEGAIYKANFTSGCASINTIITQTNLHEWRKYNVELIVTSPSNDINPF